MIRVTFLPYISLIVICAISTGCVSGGVDPNDQQAGFAGAPLEGNIDGNFGFGDDLDENFGDLDNNFDDSMFSNTAGNGGNNFNNFGNFDGGDIVNSDTRDEFNNNFGFNQSGENNIFSNQNFKNDNNFFADTGNNFAFQGNDPLQFNNNPGGFSMFDDGEGMNNALPQENELGFFANQGALDTDINPVVNRAAAKSFPRKDDGSGRVKYVTANGSTLHSQPDSSVIKNLEQGEHPLVFSEGEWSRTSDGFYIPTMTLTGDPIPRRKLKANWTY